MEEGPIFDLSFDEPPAKQARFATASPDEVADMLLKRIRDATKKGNSASGLDQGPALHPDDQCWKLYFFLSPDQSQKLSTGGGGIHCHFHKCICLPLHS